MGYLRAGAGDFRNDTVQTAVPHQITDIRHDPLAARFDELIVVKLIEIFLKDADLLRDDCQQILKRLTLLRVARPINRRQEVIQGLRVEAHARTPN